MFELPKLPKYKCPRCGAKVSSPGQCISCSMKSPHDRGYEDGRKSIFPSIDIPKYEPPKIELDLRTDYQKGYDAGRRSAQGRSGTGRFSYAGE